MAISAFGDDLEEDPVQAPGLAAAQPQAAPPRGLSAFGDALDALPDESPNRTAGQWATDIGGNIGRGAYNLFDSLAGLGDIATGGEVTPWLAQHGLDSKAARADLDAEMSPQARAERDAVQNAQGFLPTVNAALRNPAFMAAQVIESLPTMVVGGVAGKGAALGARALGMAAPAAGVVGAGTGEGLAAAGQQAASTVQQTGDLTLRQTAAALGSGALTGIIGAGSAGLGGRLGAADIDAIFSGAAGPSAGRGMFGRMGIGAGTEAGEEALQASQETAAQNTALGNPLGQNISNAAGQGALLGGLMGTASGLRRPNMITPQSTPMPMPAQQQQGQAVPVFNPQAMPAQAPASSASPIAPQPATVQVEPPHPVPFARSADIAPLLRNIGMDETRTQQTLDLLRPVEADIEAQRRGVLPVADQQRLASLIGLKGDKANAFARQVGETWAPETIIAATNNVASQYKDVLTLQQKIAGGVNVTDQDRAEFVQRLGEMRQSFGNLAGARAEAGRSMAAFRGSNFDFNRTKNILESLGTDGADDLAKAFGAAVKAGGIGNAARLINQPDTLMQKLFGYYYRSALLSNPATQVANALGNAGMLAKRSADRAGAAVVSSAKNVLGGKGETVWREPVALLRGNAANLLNATRAAGQAFVEGDNASTNVNAVEATGDMNAPGGVLHNVASLPFRGLAAGDAFFQTIHQGGELRALATRQASDEKRNGRLPAGITLSQRVDQIVADPSPQMIEASGDYSRHATFNQTAGPLVKGVLALKRKLPVLQVILPFLRTLSNIAKEVIGSTPLAGLTPKFWEDVRQGGATQEQALGKVLAGSAFITAALLAASEGAITGSGAGMDDKERRAKQATGWQPYSVLVAGKYHSIQRLDPFSSMLATAADLSTMRPGSDSATKLAGDLLGSFVANIVDRTSLAGLKNAAEFLSDPAGRGAWYLKNTFGALAQPFAVLSTLASSTDPYARESATVLGQIKYRTPGLRDDLPVKLDNWGDPVENTRQGLSMLVVPSAISAETTDPVRIESSRLGFLPPEFQKALTLKGKQTTFTPEQHHELVQLAGKLTHRGAQRLMQSPAWKKLDDDQKRDALEAAAKKARTAVRMAAIPYIHAGKRAALDRLRSSVNQRGSQR